MKKVISMLMILSALLASCAAPAEGNSAGANEEKQTGTLTEAVTTKKPPRVTQAATDPAGSDQELFESYEFIAKEQYINRPDLMWIGRETEFDCGYLKQWVSYHREYNEGPFGPGWYTDPVFEPGKLCLIMNENAENYGHKVFEHYKDQKMALFVYAVDTDSGNTVRDTYKFDTEEELFAFRAQEAEYLKTLGMEILEIPENSDYYREVGVAVAISMNDLITLVGSQAENFWGEFNDYLEEARVTKGIMTLYENKAFKVYDFPTRLEGEAYAVSQLHYDHFYLTYNFPWDNQTWRK